VAAEKRGKHHGSLPERNGNRWKQDGNKWKQGKKLSISSYNICIMEFVSNMTRAQKEQYVIELYKQDKTIREIIQRQHLHS
jgi:hypothetical protein